MRRLTFSSVALVPRRAQQTIRPRKLGLPAKPAMLRPAEHHHSFSLTSSCKDFL
jgi:hypothetical protein